MTSENASRILMVINRIPSGSVATYGQIARIAGIPKNSRQVGWVLRSGSFDPETPWFRVVNSKGEISGRGSPDSESFQRNILESENIEFDENGRIALDIFRWQM